MKTKLFILLLISLSTGSFAQSSKNGTSGKIVFDISYPDSKLDDQTMASLPTESVMLYKDDMAKVVVSMPMGKTVIISDNKSGNGTMLMDMMGKKWAIEMKKADMEKQKQDMGKTSFEKTRESKTIAGYTCYKAIVTVATKEGEMKSDVWFTNDLKAKNSVFSQIDGLEGFMLEYQTKQNGMSMKMSAKSVEMMEVNASEFVIPDGYEKMTMDDLKKMGAR